MGTTLLGLLTGGLNWLKSLPWQVYAGIGAILLLGISYCAGESHGRTEERIKWENKVAEIRKERDEQAKRAEEADEALAKQIAATITARREELDNDTANIPDQELSARQCARVRQLLRIEGRGRELPASCAAKLERATGEPESSDAAR